jgi:hypothetical protein
VNYKAGLGALLALLPGFVHSWSQSGDEDSFTFHKGARWTFEKSEDGKKGTVVQEVTSITKKDLVGEEATVFDLDTQVQDPETGEMQPPPYTTEYLALQKGFLVRGWRCIGPPSRIYKLGSKEGDTWSLNDSRFHDHPGVRAAKELTCRHLGTEAVKVPAGDFKAVHLQLNFELYGQKKTSDYFIVPKIGVVRSKTVSTENGNERTIIWELKEFRSGRDY